MTEKASSYVSLLCDADAALEPEPATSDGAWEMESSSTVHQLTQAMDLKSSITESS